MLLVRTMASGIVTRKGIKPSLTVEGRLADNLTALPPNTSFAVGGTRLTAAQIVAELRQHMTAERELTVLLERVSSARANIKAMRVRARTLRQVAKLAATAVLGSTSKDYQLLGFEVPKQRKSSAKAKAAGVVKTKATRVARGTKGSRQKQAIHG